MAISEINPAPLPPAALLALKQARRIATTADDALLVSEIRSAMALCEMFTRRILIARDFEEVLPVQRDWQDLGCMPVIAIDAVSGVPVEGPVFPLTLEAFAIDIRADGTGRVLVRRPGSAGRIKVSYRAGMAETWDDLPEPLRQGILMAASHGFLNRNGPDMAPPPASISALWHPWRVLRLD